MSDFLKASLNEALELHAVLAERADLHSQLELLASWCVDALQKGGRILFAGNGGSFADAQHLAAEFVSRLRFDRSPLPSIALATNSSSMSAIGNDYGYEHVFAREITALAGPADVFIPISTSGNSLNILLAVQAASAKSVRMMALTGDTGGQLAAQCACLCIPSSRTERIQEGHILLGHILCGMVEAAIFGKSAPSEDS
jgi:D-sedoheptulose 7-phosphate isomerase